MKFFLSMILCSGVAGSCLEPFPMTDKFYDNWQSCIIAGNEESIKKIKELNTEDFNQFKFFIKFYCQEVEVEKINA